MKARTRVPLRRACASRENGSGPIAGRDDLRGRNQGGLGRGDGILEGPMSPVSQHDNIPYYNAFARATDLYTCIRVLYARIM